MATGKTMRVSTGQMQSGRASYTHSTAQTVISVNFSKAFTATPHLVVTEENTGGYPVRCWIREISSTGFKVNAYIDNFQSSFSGYLHWIAHL